MAGNWTAEDVGRGALGIGALVIGSLGLYKLIEWFFPRPEPDKDSWFPDTFNSISGFFVMLIGIGAVAAWAPQIMRWGKTDAADWVSNKADELWKWGKRQFSSAEPATYTANGATDPGETRISFTEDPHTVCGSVLGGISPDKFNVACRHKEASERAAS